jgi:PAS domain S-box-containing protein
VPDGGFSPDSLSLRFAQAALESTADGILIVDRAGKIAGYNRRFVEMWRIPAPIVAARDDARAVRFVLGQVVSPKAFQDRVRELYARPGGESFDVIEFKDGRVFERYSRPHRVGRAIIGRVWSFRDVTDRRKLERRLAESETYWRTVLEQAPAFIANLDRRLRIVSLNRAGEGSSIGDLVGKEVLLFVAPESRTAYREAVRSVFRTGSPAHRRIRANASGGGLAWYDVRFGPIRQNGRIDSVVAIASDITKEAETAARFQAMFNSSRDAIVYVGLDGTYQEVNPAFERLTGFSRDELIRRRRMHEITPPEFRQRDKDAMRRCLATGESAVIEKEYVRKDGSRVPVNLTGFGIRGADGGIDGFAAIISDVSERRRLERELAETGAREQAKLGRDLHDTLGQTVTGLSLMAKSLRGSLSRRGAPEARDAARLVQLSSLAVRQARSLARGLLPKELQTAGLNEALRQLAVNAQDLFGVVCGVALPSGPVGVDEATAAQLYRVAQEAVNNAAKHARPRTGVRIKLSSASRSLRLEVVDDGAGIPPPHKRGQGLGLGIMAHRARMLGGSLTVKRRPGGGTVVACVCPLPRPLQGSR